MGVRVVVVWCGAMFGVLATTQFPGSVSMAEIWPRNWLERGEAQQLGITSVGSFSWPLNGL